MKHLLVVIGVALMPYWAAVEAQAPKDVQADLQARYKLLSTAVQRQDLAAIAGLYAEDASFAIATPTGRDRVRGSESIAGLWQGAIKGGAVAFAPKIVNASVKGATVSESGTFVMAKKDGGAFGKGDYTAEWRQEAGVWKLVRHELTVR